MSSLRPRSRFEWIVTLILLLKAFILALVVFYIFVPINLKGPGFLGLIGLFSSLLFIGFAIVFLLLFFWTRSRKWRLASNTILSAIAICLLIGLWPSFALWKQAKKYGVSLDVAMAILPKWNGGTQPQMIMSYDTSADGNNLQMNLFLADTARNIGPRPVIVKVHGGGWVNGSRYYLNAWDNWFNQLGYHVFDVDYRMPPPVRWLDETGDIKCALGYIAAHAAEYNLDTNRVILMGYSAGANLALLAAYSFKHSKLVPSCDVAPVKIKCVIDLYGPSDMGKLFSTTGSPNYVRPLMKQYIGGPPGVFPDRYIQLSPLSHISSSTPPTIIIQGEKDRVVPANQSTMLDSALSKSGVPHEMYMLPFCDHVFDANWNSFGSQIAREKIKLFLEKYGK